MVTRGFWLTHTRESPSVRDTNLAAQHAIQGGTRDGGEAPVCRSSVPVASCRGDARSDRTPPRPRTARQLQPVPRAARRPSRIPTRLRSQLEAGSVGRSDRASRHYGVLVYEPLVVPAHLRALGASGIRAAGTLVGRA